MLASILMTRSVWLLGAVLALSPQVIAQSQRSNYILNVVIEKEPLRVRFLLMPATLGATSFGQTQGGWGSPGRDLLGRETGAVILRP